MCMVSVVTSQAINSFPLVLRQWQGEIAPAVTRVEFDALKREVEALKNLLPAVQEYDKATGQEDCEHADKVTLVKKLAELVGVDLSEVLP